MENQNILDQGFRREMTPEEESNFHLLKMEAAIVGRRIRQGRYLSYLLTGFFLVMGLLTLLYTGPEEESLINQHFTRGLAIGLITIGVIYAGLAWLTFKFPTIAFGCMLAIFLLLALGQTNSGPASIVFDLIIKGLIIFTLTRALIGSIKMARIQKQAAELGVTPADLD